MHALMTKTNTLYLNAISDAVARTCHEYMVRGGTKSGLYDIDPDGFDFGSPPIKAFCHFEDGT